MKKVTKFLSILLLVAMCMSLFGGSAYAMELEGGNTSSSAPTVVNDGVQLNGDDTYLDGGSSSGSTDLEISEEPTIGGPILKAPVKPPVKPPVISGGEAEINGTQYETLEKALAAAKAHKADREHHHQHRCYGQHRGHDRPQRQHLEHQRRAECERCTHRDRRPH